MKRLHLHVTVADLDQAIGFYSTMFDSKPSKIKSDYAKWQLQDPCVNFAISTRSSKVGLDHLGIQVDADEEVLEVRNRLSENNFETGDINSGVCCYSESTKFWTEDPAGIPWESFVSMSDAEVYGVDMLKSEESACCAPDTTSKASSCC